MKVTRPSKYSITPLKSKRSVIPALQRFHFKGVIEYLEGLVTFVDAPQLNALFITFFDQIDFDGPRLAQFISCTPILEDFDPLVGFDDSTAIVRLPNTTLFRRPFGPPSPLNETVIQISCREPDWQLSSVAQVCSSCLPPLSMIEDLVTSIDAPQLDHLNITFFNQIDFDCPRLAQFISRIPILADCDAHMEFDNYTASVRLPSPLKRLAIGISCRDPDWQLSSVAQVCDSCLPPLSTIENLYIEHQYSQLVWKNDAIENALWLELLRPFPVVKNLYLSRDFAPGIVATLQEIVETEVLPRLQNIFVKELAPDDPFQENIEQFVTARQHSGRPIAISVWGYDVYSDVDLDADLDVDLDEDSDVNSDADLDAGSDVDSDADSDADWWRP